MGRYSDIVLRRSRYPLNKRPICGDVEKVECESSFCGDHFTVSILVEDGVVKDAGFDGCGCAVSTAAADIAVGNIIGVKVEEIPFSENDFEHKQFSVWMGTPRRGCVELVRDAIDRWAMGCIKNGW